MIQFTIGQAWAVILSVCGGIVTIAAVVGIVVRLVSFFRRPEQRQDNRLDALTERLDKLEAKSDLYMQYFENDKRKIELIEKGNQVTQHALLALLANAIDGNDVDALKTATKNLEEFLIMR